MMSTPIKPVTPEEANPHAATRELLPWIVNGTLAGAELERVEAHLAACPACCEQLEWERGLHAAAAAAAAAPPPLSAEDAFARLQPRLGPQEQGSSIPLRLRALAAANDPRWLRSVAALQLAVIIVLGLVAVRPGEDEASYRTLGAQPAAQGSLVVSFDPATPERELRRILQASGARVVDGPTASGAYVLAVAPGDAGPALLRLRAEPAVRLAEPLTLESRR
jgi:anti-sigma factor RsiW